MTPVIPARPGGLFAADWTPEGRGVAYPYPRAWCDAHSVTFAAHQRPAFECPCPISRWQPGTNTGKSTARGCAVDCVTTSRISRRPVLLPMRRTATRAPSNPNTPVVSWPRCCSRKFAWGCFDARRHPGGGAARPMPGALALTANFSLWLKSLIVASYLNLKLAKVVYSGDKPA